MMDAIFERFVAGTPITVMAQLGFERVLDPAWLDQMFDEYRGRQYERELLFSTVVDIVALVALGLQPGACSRAKSRRTARLAQRSLRQAQPYRASARSRSGEAKRPAS